MGTAGLGDIGRCETHLGFFQLDADSSFPIAAPIINFFYVKSRSLFNSFSAKRYTTLESTTREKNIVATVRDADGFVDLCEIWNDGSYRIEEHVVQTGDGYLLGLHRVVKKSDEEISRENAGARPRVRRGADGSVRGNGGKKVVYLHHGQSDFVAPDISVMLMATRTFDEQRSLGLPVGQGAMSSICSGGARLRRLG
jgi:hypothetical protein